MKTLGLFFFFSSLLFSINSPAQKPDTLIRKLDSLGHITDSSGSQINNTDRAAFNAKTIITPKAYLVLLVSDIKQEFTAPFHFNKKSWLKAGAIALTTIGLGFADEPVQRVSLELRNKSSTVRHVSSYITNLGGTYEAYTLVTLGALGFITKNEKLKTTTLLATQSYITGGIMGYTLKFLTNRQRPSYIEPTDPEPEPEFHGPFTNETPKKTRGFSSAFPSGHTTDAFAAATVFAMEYRDKWVVPVIAYSVAGLIGLSRLTENKHWLTDIFAGAALGYFTGRQVVNNYHRYAQIREAGAKKNKVSFNLHYVNRTLMPGLVYTFR